MSNSHLSNSTVPYIEVAMQDLNIKGDMAAPNSKYQGGVKASFETMMKELACKIQGKMQGVQQFAAQIEASVINIYQRYLREWMKMKWQTRREKDSTRE